MVWDPPPSPAPPPPPSGAELLKGARGEGGGGFIGTEFLEVNFWASPETHAPKNHPLPYRVAPSGVLTHSSKLCKRKKAI